MRERRDADFVTARTCILIHSISHRKEVSLFLRCTRLVNGISTKINAQQMIIISAVYTNAQNVFRLACFFLFVKFLNMQRLNQSHTISGKLRLRHRKPKHSPEQLNRLK